MKSKGPLFSPHNKLWSHQLYVLTIGREKKEVYCKPITCLYFCTTRSSASIVLPRIASCFWPIPTMNTLKVLWCSRLKENFLEFALQLYLQAVASHHFCICLVWNNKTGEEMALISVSAWHLFAWWGEQLSRETACLCISMRGGRSWAKLLPGRERRQGTKYSSSQPTPRAG